MRLWHKYLIPYLPRQQLLAQWRECCCIAKNIKENGTPNHILVNKILNYPMNHFKAYCDLVCIEMEARGYRCDFHRLEIWLSDVYDYISDDSIFTGWHNDRYLIQCYFNLQEKFDCGGITDAEWKKIAHSEIVCNLFTKNPHTQYNF